MFQIPHAQQIKLNLIHYSQYTLISEGLSFILLS